MAVAGIVSPMLAILSRNPDSGWFAAGAKRRRGSRPGLRQQHEQRYDDADEGLGDSGLGYAGLDDRRHCFCEPDDRYQRRAEDQGWPEWLAGWEEVRARLFAGSPRAAMGRRKSRWRTVWVRTNSASGVSDAVAANPS